ncbi:MAG: hypothetical protein JSV96_09020, partial [Candidatus Aminicenantes bacterium]
MDALKEFFFKHFEKIIVVIVILGIVIINYFASYKIGFLNFFYLPIILAGYSLGKRMAVLTALLCILIVTLFVIISPASFFSGMEKISVIV